MLASVADLMGRSFSDNRISYSDRDTMLYGLSIGFGVNPLDERQLRYVFERPALNTVPSMATVVARGLGLLAGAGLDMNKVLHGEQRLTIHRPLPSAAELITEGRIEAVLDKGPGKGLLIYTSTTARIAGEDAPILSHGNTIFARGDGGIGSAGQTVPVHRIPQRPADRSVSLCTREDLALLYRLNGDANPLHADPAVAKQAGFPRPILHGLCTYGLACRSVIEAACDFDATRISQFDVRFSKPVFPGETITTDLWIDGSIISFRCRIDARDTLVLDNGLCVLNPSA